jgi:cytochrome b561
MNNPSPAVRYDRTTILLHWVSATLVVLLWSIAQVIDLFPKGTPRIAVRSVHILLGVTLGVVLLARVIWRGGSGRRLPRATPGLAGHAAKVVHYGLYILLAGTVTLGIANVWVRGDTIVGLFTVPKFAPGDKELKETVENLHAWLANTILIVAGLHAVAALVNHFALRNNVLRRMLPGRDSQ